MPDDFDTQLNAIMEGNFNEPAPTEPAPKDTPAPAPGTANSGAVEKTWKAAGRDWKGDDLAKAHDSLVREFGSRNKDWEDLKGLRTVREQLNKDPEFNRYFRSAIEAYQNARNAGQSKDSAQKQTGLPPELAAKLEKVDRFEELADRMEFEREEAQVTKKFNLDADTLKKVEDYSYAHKGLALEDSYKQMMFDLNQSKIAEKKEADLAKRKEASRGNGPTPEHIAPSAKGINIKSDAEWRRGAGDALSKFGLSD